MPQDLTLDLRVRRIDWSCTESVERDLNRLHRKVFELAYGEKGSPDALEVFADELETLLNFIGGGIDGYSEYVRKVFDEAWAKFKCSMR